MIIYIINNYPYHYEIIESIINYYNIILNIKKNIDDEIYITFKKNDSFKNYIKNKYKNIIITKPELYDFSINCNFEINNDFQIYQKDYYISHDVRDGINFPNIFYLTPLCNTHKYIYADILPFMNEKIETSIPIYIVQGNIDPENRDFSLLEKILEINTDYKYKIKIIGRKKLNYNIEDLYKRHNDKLIIKKNLNFEDYHKEFLDGYSIIPLITKKKYNKYYNYKLTSSINYAKAYNLKCLIDLDLQSIYKLKNIETFTDITDISEAFKNTLNYFYKNKTY
jgi:hypothetical protein